MRRRSLLILFVCLTLTALLTIPAITQETEKEEPVVITFEQPVLITSIGQSAGAAQAKILAMKADLDFVYEQRASLDDLEGMKTLIVVMGASGKGLGAAGVDIGAEIAWATELFDRARELEIVIIAMHIEGSSRRGPMSDQINTTFAPLADYLIIKGSATEEEAANTDEAANGNLDGLFTTISEENEIPIVFVTKTLDVVPVLKSLFPAKEEE
ncbi:MAG TPA: hypothetical protein ENL23_03555 [Candidatus Acetothermia bacterium]|nr:hypothetical protein [Candidatus Acetothermia bacterium]